ncbi:Flap-structured DNA-binding and RNA-binding protein [Massospora cicadina]|nr:Flap-structured DNA-binding and RNA-binding protein [Massospora cicadina]
MSEHLSTPRLTSSSPTYPQTKLNSIRPNSEVYPQKPTASHEAEVLDKWFEDLAQYERILEEMSKASLEPSFKEELGAVENWFSALSQAEKTAALYSLLHQSNAVQIRFFITVLQKLNNDPVRNVLSPAFSRHGLQSFPLPTREKNFDRHSMPTGKTDLPRPSSLGVESSYSSRLSVKGQTYTEDGMGFKWKASPSRIPALDLKGASNWAGWDLSYSMGGEKSLSATNVKDSNWGKLRNSNNLTLNADNVEARADSFLWHGSSARPVSAKSPAFPPGLCTASSPIPSAATPTPLDPFQSPKSADEIKEPKPLDPVDFEVLEKHDLREVIALDDKQLSEVGVAALGARRKFLKVFEHVKHEAELKGISTKIEN